MHRPLTQDVMQELGLSRQPFDAVAGEDFLYLDPAIEAPTRLLMDKARGGGLLIFFRGEAGAGKTTHLERFRGVMGDDLPVFLFRAASGTGMEEIAAALRQWCDSEGHEAGGQSVREILEDMLVVGKRPVVVIDDADLLTAKALAELVRLRGELELEDNDSFTLILSAPQSFEKVLEGLGTDAAGRVAVPLRPLTEDQTAAYLRYRLQMAGNENPDFLTDGMITVIFRDSGGLPGSINDAAMGTLTALVDPDAASEEHEAEPEPLAETEAEAASGSEPQEWEQSFPVVVDDAEEELEMPAADIEPESMPEFDSDPDLNLDLDGLRRKKEEAAIRPGGRRFARLVILVILIGVAATAANIFLGIWGGGEEERVEPIILPPERPIVPVEIPPPVVEEVDITDDLVEELVGPVMEEIAEPEVAGPEVAGEEKAPVEAEPKEEVVEEPPAPTAATAAVTPADGAAWVRAQQPGGYTIQILGSGAEAPMRDYIRRHGLDGVAAVVHTVRDGKAWYVLVAGSHPTADAARAAVAELPEEVQTNKPWIRTFGSLVEAMP